jgi:heme o synthase
MIEKIKNFLLVAKPGIIFGNLITAVGGFLLASKGHIDITILLPTITGISLVVASGCVLNNCLDRKIDRKMARTCNRVLAQRLMSPRVAVFYASFLGISGTALLWAAANMLTVVIVLTGFGIYVGVYSLFLKRNSVYATLIGSLAGATPPLAGAVILLSIFSLWQIPHSYAISIFRYDDYAAAAIPVLPVKQEMPIVKRHIVGYILAFMAATLTLGFGGYTGYSYLAVAATVGLLWLHMALTGFKASNDRLWAKKLFTFSLITIFILSVMMSIDFTVPAASDMLLTYFP